MKQDVETHYDPEDEGKKARFHLGPVTHQLECD